MSASQPSLFLRIRQWQEPLVVGYQQRSRQLRGVWRPALRSCSLVSASLALIDIGSLTLLLCGYTECVSAHKLNFGIYVAVGLLAAFTTNAMRSRYAVARLLQWRQAAAATIVPLLCAIGAVAALLSASGVNAHKLAPIAVLAVIVGLAVLSVTRIVASVVIAQGIASGWLRYDVAVFGDASGRIAAWFEESGSTMVRLIGVYDAADSTAEPQYSINAILARTRQERVDAIILAYPPEAADRMRRVFESLDSSVADIFISNVTNRRGLVSEGHPLADLPLLPAQRPALSDFDLVIKTVFDRVIGCLLLLLLSPLLAVVAIAIKLDSPGDILFRQPRVGYNNALFTMYKFRSMHHHAADLGARQQTTRGDARITRVGQIIRRFSIDELPQLINVMGGQMSLVGPRPHAPGTNIEGRLLEQVNSKYPCRHRVLPGITGWAQINGSRGALTSASQFARRVTLDLYYIDHWSIWLDLRIIVLTILRELVSKRAY